MFGHGFEAFFELLHLELAQELWVNFCEGWGWLFGLDFHDMKSDGALDGAFDISFVHGEDDLFEVFQNLTTFDVAEVATFFAAGVL